MSTENFVIRGLQSMGFNVRRIDIAQIKTPDLLVSDTDSKYLIEIKEKFPDPQMMKQRSEILARGSIWAEENTLGYRNTISYIVREAADQLISFQSEPVEFRLVWLHARERHADTQLKQFKATLFGCVDLIDLDELADSVPARPCFFFGFSEFFRFRDVLDGAFVSTDDRCLLCINTLSPRGHLLRGSHLCTSFQPGVYDPEELDRRGDAYIADCDIGRRNKAGVLEYVKNKYKRPRLIDFEPTRYSAETLVSSSSDNEIT